MANVFENTILAGIPLKNRILRSATYEGMADENGCPTEQLAELYIKLAKGGVGAIITGYAGVKKNGKAASKMLMIDRDELIPDYQNLVNRVKEHGVPLILQIAHGGGQAMPADTGEAPAAPSPQKYPTTNTTARELSSGEIEEIIESFVQAIERAQRAGFDGVQLHAAHAYLLSEFLSPAMNRRNDAWGGNTENRFRIIGEIIRRARERIGSYPILMKFSAYDRDKNGMRVEEAVKIARLFEAAGGDAMEISCGGATDGFLAIRVKEKPVEAILKLMPPFCNMASWQKALFKPVISLVLKKHGPLYNFNVEAAAEIKKQVHIPVIVVGGIRKLAAMNEIISAGQADYVSMCRPFIIEPGIVNKLATGSSEGSQCLECAYCLLGIRNKPLHCYYGRI